MKERFLNLFEEALDKDENSVKMEDAFRSYEEWDSLAVLSVVAMLDEEYDINIPQKDFTELQTVKDIYDYIISEGK